MRSLRERPTGRLWGDNVINALAAAAPALATGVDYAQVVAGLTVARIDSGERMEVTTRADGVTAIDDAFNASPEPVLAALDTLTDIAAGRRALAVLGEMAELGDTAARWYAEVGRKAAATQLAYLIVVGDGHADVLADAATTPTGPTVHPLPDAQRVLEWLAETGDTALVKGVNHLGLETWPPLSPAKRERARPNRSGRTQPPAVNCEGSIGCGT